MSDEERAAKIVDVWCRKGLTDEEGVALIAANLCAVRDEATQLEREACAKLVEDADVKTYGGFYDNDNGQATLDGAAAAIRARGQS